MYLHDNNLRIEGLGLKTDRTAICLRLLPKIILSIVCLEAWNQLLKNLIKYLVQDYLVIIEIVLDNKAYQIMQDLLSF